MIYNFYKDTFVLKQFCNRISLKTKYLLKVYIFQLATQSNLSDRDKLTQELHLIEQGIFEKEKELRLVSKYIYIYIYYLLFNSLYIYSRLSIIQTLQLLTSANRKNAVYFDTLDNSKSFS